MLKYLLHFVREQSGFAVLLAFRLLYSLSLLQTLKNLVKGNSRKTVFLRHGNFTLNINYKDVYFEML